MFASIFGSVRRGYVLMIITLQGYIVGNPDAQVTIVSGMASSSSSQYRMGSSLLVGQIGTYFRSVSRSVTICRILIARWAEATAGQFTRRVF